MAQASGTFRIFVSSTFADLKQERDALQRHVFPRLRELCERAGARFQAIDLRWGVSQEATLDQRTMPICLTEIARCQHTTPRPNFVILLGDRYGWRPLPHELTLAEFAAIEARADPEDRGRLRYWYPCDDNGRPPVHYLRSRSGRFEEVATWEGVEGRLLALLMKVDARRYGASATEQEIVHGALKVDDARDHVFCFFRELDELPPDASAADFVELDDDARARLTRLKTELGRRLDGNVYRYSAGWSETTVTTAHLGDLPEALEECLRLLDDGVTWPTTLCADVWRCVGNVIRGQLELLSHLEPLAQEIESHRAFGRERRRGFVGRHYALRTISSYLRGDNPTLLAVVSEPGSGKSALMALASRCAVREHRNAVVVLRFIGGTPASTSKRELLSDLCREISDAYGAPESEVPATGWDLAVEFGRRLELATAARPLFLFVDGLDQFSDDEPSWCLIPFPSTFVSSCRRWPGMSCPRSRGGRRLQTSSSWVPCRKPKRTGCSSAGSGGRGGRSETISDGNFSRNSSAPDDFPCTSSWASRRRASGVRTPINS